MNNNTESLGTDPEVQVAPEPTVEPAPLAYAPQATIVYNASESYYGGVVPTEINAHDISGAIRAGSVRGLQVVKLNAQIAKVEELLKETLTEVSDSEWIDFIKEIAEALDISIKRTYSVTATVEHTFEVEVGIGEDEPSEDDFTFSVSSYDWGIESDRESVTDFEAEEI